MEAKEAIKRLNEARFTPKFQPYPYMNEAIEFAVKALEKQIPKTVIKKHYEDAHELEYVKMVCPSCGVSFAQKSDWCPNCGQRLGWENEK